MTRPPPTEERLAKRLAHQIGCSRREAEQYIEGGWVRVDGQVVETPQFRVSTQQIELDPKAKPQTLQPVTLLLHQPPSSGRDSDAATTEQARALLRPDTHWAAPYGPQGPRILQRHFQQLEAGMALERGASGLLVFTQDWRVARKLHEDAAVLEQEYLVEVRGELTPAALQALHRRSGSQGQSLPQVKASLNSTAEDVSRLRFAVKGQHPGLIAFLCDGAGLTIVAMKRIRIGRVALGALPVQRWSYLPDSTRF